MKKRQAIWEDIKGTKSCDVLILGGGVNGAGLLRDLALQGIHAILVDKGDFTAGASSKSSRMIHGGLRYLENAEFKLVTEAVNERNRLLANAPHFVSPLQTTIPIKSWLSGLIKSPMVFFGLPVTPGGRGALIVKMGLTFYDLISGKRRRTPRHYFTLKSKSLHEIPGLRTDIVCTATYWDAWVSQIERLCVDMIGQACLENPQCQALNYVTASKNAADEVCLTDQVTGESVTMKPKIVVNATGAWIDLTNHTLGLDSQLMGGTKGSHLVVDNAALYETLGDRMVYYEHADGRICITFRFMGKVIVGSTDMRVEDPDQAACEDDEIDYMMTTLKGVFPGLNLSHDDIVFTFCGVRPLPSSGLDYTSRVPRSHRLDVAEPDEQHGFPIYSMIGGKLTTFRAFAEQATDKILTELGKSRAASTEDLTYQGAEDYPAGEDARQSWIQRVARATDLDETRVADLLDRYGTQAESFAQIKDTPWSTALQNLPNYTVGEIEYLAKEECIRHLSDLVRRRSVITMLGQASEAALVELAEIVGTVLEWDKSQRTEEVKLARQEATDRK